MTKFDYDNAMQVLMEAQEALDYTDKQVASLTDTTTSTFSRYKNGQTRPPLSFFLAACNVLGVPPKKIGISLDDADEENDEVTENVAKIFAERLNEKNAQLEYRAGLINKLQEEVTEQHKMFHEMNRKNIERIDRMTSESKEREDRKNKIIIRQSRTIMILGIALAALTVFTIYFMIDAFNGDWGIVRYIMELFPDPSNGADSGQEIVNGITGLWNRM